MTTFTNEEIQYEQFVNGYICLSAFLVLYYDYLLTLPLEVARFWPQRMDGVRIRWAQFFFYLNRYMALVGHIPVMFEYFWVSARPDKIVICDQLQSYHQYFAIVMQLVGGALLMMRMYAMFDRNRYILGVLIGEAAAATAFGAWVIVSAEPPPPDEMPRSMPYVGCRQEIDDDAGRRFALAWTGLLIFDGTVFAMTLYKALSSVLWRAPGLRRNILMGRGGRGSGLLTILLRDGSVYFATMVVVNLLNILSFIFLKGHLKGTGTTWVNVISTSMTSRLMLNLRDPTLRPPDASRNVLTTVGPGIFTTAAGMFTTGVDGYTTMTYGDSAGTGESSRSWGTDRDIELCSRTPAVVDR